MVALAFFASHADGHMVAPLYDPVALNVGVNCRWDRTCERRQFQAMARARRYVATAHPPLWRVHLCNRNAARGTANVDWIGFDDCIHNGHLHRPSSRIHRRR